MNDNPHQKAIAPILAGQSPRTARIGDNPAQLDYEVNMAVRDAEFAAKAPTDRCNVGYAHMKNRR